MIAFLHNHKRWVIFVVIVLLVVFGCKGMNYWARSREKEYRDAKDKCSQTVHDALPWLWMFEPFDSRARRINPFKSRVTIDLGEDPYFISKPKTIDFTAHTYDSALAISIHIEGVYALADNSLKLNCAVSQDGNAARKFTIEAELQSADADGNKWRVRYLQDKQPEKNDSGLLTIIDMEEKIEDNKVKKTLSATYASDKDKKIKEISRVQTSLRK